MCGIAGWAGELDPRPDDALQRMCTALSHRGPDDEGSFVKPGVALGFKRLSIIDLTTGNQPIPNEAATVHATCNGEIYNFRELRRKLEREGHAFSTGSDAETIVHLYEDHGPDFVHHLHGMFAIALWDSTRRRLMLVRDRLGVKPLYFAELPRGVAYASEPAALIASGLVTAQPDVSALARYMTLQYVPGSDSGFRGIKKLEPSQMLIYEGGRSTLRTYWSLDYSKTNPARRRADALDELDELLGNVTRERTVADVPLGAFLSGGIDSSLVVSYMAEASSAVRTFSVDFAEERFSEGRHARRVAALYGTDHTEDRLEPNVLGLTESVVRHAGEPFADASALPTYLLSESARRQVTVALSGDGGDEAFAGYRRYALARGVDGLSFAQPAARRVAGALNARPLSLPRELSRGLSVLAQPANDRYASMMSHFSPAQLVDFCTPEFLSEAGAGAHAWHDSLRLGELTGVDRYLELDTRTYLPGDLLLKVDRMSMAHGLEVRSPLLDHRVFEFAATLPGEAKLRRFKTKALLKELASRRGLPDDLVHRRKQGFGVPVGEWMRDALRPWVTDLLCSQRFVERGYVKRGAVDALMREHMAGTADHANQLWNLAMLELWHQRWIDAVPGVARSAA